MQRVKSEGETKGTTRKGVLRRYLGKEKNTKRKKIVKKDLHLTKPEPGF